MYGTWSTVVVLHLRTLLARMYNFRYHFHSTLRVDYTFIIYHINNKILFFLLLGRQRSTIS